MELVIEDLDAAGALSAFGDLRRVRARVERDILVLGTHFADLYNLDSADLASPELPGTERSVRVAGEGAPLVREFAVAQMAAELATTSHAARSLMGDGLELRHRLLRLWARVGPDPAAGHPSPTCSGTRSPPLPERRPPGAGRSQAPLAAVDTTSEAQLVPKAATQAGGSKTPQPCRTSTAEPSVAHGASH